MNITVVGLSSTVLLSQYNNVRALDIVQAKVDLINQGRSLIKDKEFEDFLANKDLQIEATTNKKYSCGHQPEFVVIAAPTDYYDENDQFNTETLESALEDALSCAPKATIIIKSTIPVGYT